ncbi:MAG: AMP-binding protein [Rhodobacteraceae bacterium]|nr:AMP-binding protein [Paracoccaceae bacterium]MBT4777166.1 AMP-binding protein [Paracoccaceae bacterium]MBT6271912.1 AMP-binding protein [Paracoccaceae bacterium]MBT6437138.1 AMP-binding protein [Paracoccaceae bacterium]
MGWMSNEQGLEKTKANYVPLTPLSHLKRASIAFPNRLALSYGSKKYNYLQYHKRVTLLASSLTARGINPGDVIATILPNIPAQVEAHFGIPAAGAVINTINTRLDVKTVSYIFDHGEAKIVLVDTQFLSLAKQAKRMCKGLGPEIIEVEDKDAGFPKSGDYLEYEELLNTGSDNFSWQLPEDEWESLSLNYTSGTTGQPKGVVCHHRGAYLMTMGTVVSWKLQLYPKLLIIVPLFHCNGWNHTWMMPMLGGTVYCCRDVTAKSIYTAISEENITHLGGAPIVLNSIINCPDPDKKSFSHTVEIFTAGAPPAPTTLAAIEAMGFNVTQVYGLTETYGHVTECIWDEKWDNEPQEKKSEIKARQGVAFPMMEEITVLDKNQKEIPKDGKTLGEIAIRGNSVMKGYYKNPAATIEAFSGGFFHSGDIAMMHDDNYIQIADRAKDIIISGGENVSSVEVEGVLMSHPAVMLCAVVAKVDNKWGEVPCAFVELKEGLNVTEEELIAFARNQLAGFKTPKHVFFQDLPKTSTGKIQKFELRQKTKSL